MKITEIRNSVPIVYEPKEIKAEEITRAKEYFIVDSNSINIEKENWNKQILLDALEKLENNLQTDDSHPLGRNENKPIETFEEALAELKFLKSSEKFKEFAAAAQANIEAKDVLSLFTGKEEPAQNYFDII